MAVNANIEEFSAADERVSFHTFVFPFRWVVDGNPGIPGAKGGSTSAKGTGMDTRREFAKCLNDRFKMVDATWLDCDGNDAGGDWEQGYAVYQYFNNAARRLMTCNSSEASGKFGLESDVVWNYRFVPPKGTGKLSYYICCAGDSENRCANSGQGACASGGERDCLRKTEYFLPVRAIWVKLFDMGIGLLVFELEYWGHKRVTYPACASLKSNNSSQQWERTPFEDVNIINERGRRVFPPFLGKAVSEKSGGRGLSADAIALVWDNGESWDYYYDDDLVENNTFTKISFRKEHDGSFDPLVPNFVSYFLTGSFCEDGRKTVFTADVFDGDGEPDGEVCSTDGKVHYAIDPIIDERMFTMCFLGDKDFSDRIKGGDCRQGAGDYPYLTDRDVMEDLYCFGFIDEHGSCSCQNRVMLKDMLQTHVYARWIDYGTVNISSEYSFMCLSSGMPSLLTNPFLTEYQQIIYIVLAQRASLLSLESLISQYALEAHKDKDEEGKEFESLEYTMGLKVRGLQRRHIYFSSRYLLPEITSQQQGIELYDMLLDTMLVDKRSQQIDKQINDLFDLKNNEYDLDESRDNRAQNAVLFVIALAGLISLACDLAGAPLEGVVNDGWFLLLFVFIFGALYGLIRKFGYHVSDLAKSIRNRSS
ncbi:MAG: hypothetical protein ACI4B6_07500 [Atopobiaceae bacterium]